MGRLGSRPEITNWKISTPNERRAASAKRRHGRQPATLSAAPSGRNSAAFRTPSASAPSPHSTQRIGGGSFRAPGGTSRTPGNTTSHQVREPPGHPIRGENGGGRAVPGG